MTIESGAMEKRLDEADTLLKRLVSSKALAEAPFYGYSEAMLLARRYLEKNNLIDKKNYGLYDKYTVSRVDGKPIVDGCVVMEWKDPHARAAIATFAIEVRTSGFGKLADDLEARLAEYAVEA